MAREAPTPSPEGKYEAKLTVAEPFFSHHNISRKATVLMSNKQTENIRDLISYNQKNLLKNMETDNTKVVPI